MMGFALGMRPAMKRLDPDDMHYIAIPVEDELPELPGALRVNVFGGGGGGGGGGGVVSIHYGHAEAALPEWDSIVPILVTASPPTDRRKNFDPARVRNASSINSSPSRSK